MNYHPIIGIMVFIICVLLAYFLGRRINAAKNNNIDTKYLSNEYKSGVLGIHAPDAPWLRNKK